MTTRCRWSPPSRRCRGSPGRDNPGRSRLGPGTRHRFPHPEELMAQLPAREDCDDEAVAEGARIPDRQWLCDVAADCTGKCMLIAAALTLIERSLLPIALYSSSQPGGAAAARPPAYHAPDGGHRRAAAAAAWSPNAEERRKALLAYLMEALPAIIWDNIPRGAQIVARTSNDLAPQRSIRTAASASANWSPSPLPSFTFHRQQHRPPRRPRLPRADGATGNRAA